MAEGESSYVRHEARGCCASSKCADYISTYCWDRVQKHQISYAHTWARGVPILHTIIDFTCIKNSHWTGVVMGSLKEEHFPFSPELLNMENFSYLSVAHAKDFEQQYRCVTLCNS